MPFLRRSYLPSPAGAIIEFLTATRTARRNETMPDVGSASSAAVRKYARHGRSSSD
jgi:hypothetical protein